MQSGQLSAAVAAIREMGRLTGNSTNLFDLRASAFQQLIKAACGKIVLFVLARPCSSIGK
jgi:hypothetical protein